MHAIELNLDVPHRSCLTRHPIDCNNEHLFILRFGVEYCGVLKHDHGFITSLQSQKITPQTKDLHRFFIPFTAMQHFGIRYLLFCVLLTAACIALWQYPESEPNLTNGVDYSFLINLRPIGLIAAVTIFMHVACDAIGLTSFTRWLMAILPPSIAMLGWWLWWVARIKQSNAHHPITIGPFEVLIVHLVTFTISFAVISGLLSLARSVPILSPTEHQHDSAG